VLVGMQNGLAALPYHDGAVVATHVGLQLYSARTALEIRMFLKSVGVRL
jgi:hypothetical protein